MSYYAEVFEKYIPPYRSADATGDRRGRGERPRKVEDRRGDPGDPPVQVKEDDPALVEQQGDDSREQGGPALRVVEQHGDDREQGDQVVEQQADPLAQIKQKVQKIQQGDNKLYKCGNCTKTFVRERDLIRRHLPTCKVAKVGNFLCSYLYLFSF